MGCVVDSRWYHAVMRAGKKARGWATRARLSASRKDAFLNRRDFLRFAAAASASLALPGTARVFQRPATANRVTPAQSAPPLRVVTYNVRSCKGLDSRVRPERVAGILRKIDSDVIALQEVRAEQAKEIAQRLGYNFFYGHADNVHRYDFGNAILSRFAMRDTRLYPIGVPQRQQRACLRADIAWPDRTHVVHVFTVHLGLSSAERRDQAARLVSPQILADPAIQHEPRVLLGDFNEKSRNGDVNRHLAMLLRRFGKNTYPAFLPIIDLDRIYISSDLTLRSIRPYLFGAALIASDHAPLVAVLEQATPRPENDPR
jgi:endonuclease/exonuclease/phosphatase family metal-dependent hydrolase